MQGHLINEHESLYGLKYAPLIGPRQPTHWTYNWFSRISEHRSFDPRITKIKHPKKNSTNNPHFFCNKRKKQNKNEMIERWNLKKYCLQKKIKIRRDFFLQQKWKFDKWEVHLGKLYLFNNFDGFVINHAFDYFLRILLTNYNFEFCSVTLQIIHDLKSASENCVTHFCENFKNGIFTVSPSISGKI